MLSSNYSNNHNKEKNNLLNQEGPNLTTNLTYWVINSPMHRMKHQLLSKCGKV